jgi:hypothetical protein
MPGQRVVNGRPPPRRLAILLSFLAAGSVLAGLAASLSGPAPAPRGAEAGHPAAGAAPAAGGFPGRPGPLPCSGTAAEHLERARHLLERSRADTAGAGREALLQAEAEVEAALCVGPADLASAWRLLAEVSGELASGWAADDRERQGFLLLERQALHGLLEATPGDGEARYRYAMLIADRGRRIEELTRAARQLPRDPRPRRALGEELLEAGREDEGIRLLVEAAEVCSPEELGHQGPDIVRLLRLYGREEEEARLRERLEHLGH